MLLLGVCSRSWDLSAQRSVALKCLQPIGFAPQSPSLCRGSRGCRGQVICDAIRSETNATGVSGTHGGRSPVPAGVPRLPGGDVGSQTQPCLNIPQWFWGNSLGNPSLGFPVHCMSKRAGDTQVGPHKYGWDLHWCRILTFPALAPAKITGFISGISLVQVATPPARWLQSSLREEITAPHSCPRWPLCLPQPGP